MYTFKKFDLPHCLCLTYEEEMKMDVNKWLSKFQSMWWNMAAKCM